MDSLGKKFNGCWTAIQIKPRNHNKIKRNFIERWRQIRATNAIKKRLHAQWLLFHTFFAFIRQIANDWHPSLATLIFVQITSTYANMYAFWNACKKCIQHAIGMRAARIYVLCVAYVSPCTHSFIRMLVKWNFSMNSLFFAAILCQTVFIHSWILWLSGDKFQWIFISRRSEHICRMSGSTRIVTVTQKALHDIIRNFATKYYPQGHIGIFSYNVLVCE